MNSENFKGSEIIDPRYLVFNLIEKIFRLTVEKCEKISPFSNKCQDKNTQPKLSINGLFWREKHVLYHVKEQKQYFKKSGVIALQFFKKRPACKNKFPDKNIRLKMLSCTLVFNLKLKFNPKKLKFSFLLDKVNFKQLKSFFNLS